MSDVVAWLSQLVRAPWAITLGAVFAALIVGRVIVGIARPLFSKLAGHTANDWDDRLVDLLATPMSLVLALQGLRIASPWLPLDARGTTVLHNVIGIGTTIAVLWTAFRVVDLARSVLEQRSWAVARPSSRSLVAIGSRFAKVALIVIAGIAALAQLGVSVASLVAGLGIGGLAVALAAQKTLENLFGTMSIGIDQPMREGDFVKLYDFVGTVEQIGLRSTRIRTLDRTIITVPNGELANQRIESYTARDRMRLATTINLVRSTTSQQMRAILEALEAILRRHPKIWTESVTVRFKELATSSLDIEINAWFETPEWSEFQAIRQAVLLDFMEAIEANGSAIAFPTRTVHFAGPSNGVGAPAAVQAHEPPRARD